MPRALFGHVIVLLGVGLYARLPAFSREMDAQLSLSSVEQATPFIITLHVLGTGANTSPTTAPHLLHPGNNWPSSKLLTFDRTRTFITACRM